MIDPVYDVDVVDGDICPRCQIRPSGSEKDHYFCDRCVSNFTVANRTTGRRDTQDFQTEAKRELARRELARRRLLAYVRYMMPDYLSGWFHADLAARLERFLQAVLRGEGPRLQLSCPPRIGKSELASKKFISWALGAHPHLRFIAATHSDRLALDNSRDVLTDMQSSEHQAVFEDSHLNPDAKGTMGWRTDQGGMYKPVGVGAGIAGYGAHILGIDDPHRDQEAYSAVMRERVYKWYKSSARTRLLPGGGILLIQTRWVVDDLSGRLVEEEGTIEEGGRWERVVYPAEAEHDEYRLPNGRIISIPHPKATLLRRQGELLHPERYTEKDYSEARKDEVVWQALYQQNPTAGDAGQFTEEMFDKSACLMSEVPKHTPRYTAWDTAQGEKQTSDYCVGLTGTEDADGVLWIVDVKREQLKPDDLIDAIIDDWLEHRATLVGVERTQFVVGLESAFERRLAERRAWHLPLEHLLHGNKDKVTRAGPIKARMRAGMVRIPIDAPWYADFKRELMEFFGGRHDDQVDAFAYLGQMLLDMALSPPPKPPPKKSWRDKLKAQTRNQDWRAA